MRSPRSTWVLAVVGATMLMAAPIGAGPRLSPSQRIPKAVQQEWLPGTDHSLSVCKLGEHGPPFRDENVIYFGSDDQYYTWLKIGADSCAACTTGTFANVTAAHLGIYYPFAPETLSVQTSIVGVTQATCRFQDINITVCSQVVNTWIQPDPLMTVDYAIPLNQPCIIYTPPAGSGQAFLAFNFISASDTTVAHRPRLSVQQSGRFCTSFNPVGFTNLDFVATYTTGNPIMYVDVESCELVPVRRQSWGRLKQHYR